MSLRKIAKIGFVFLVTGLMFFANSAIAQDKSEGHEEVAVTYFSAPFGTTAYQIAVAFEDVAKKDGSWVDVNAQETPGAMYSIKYTIKNQSNIDAGEMPQILAFGSTAILAHVIEGRKPFSNMAIPSDRALFGGPGYLYFYVTYDESIKSGRNFTGKKVGVGEKSRPFAGDLVNRPYFEKGLENFKKIDWQYLGSANSKSAMLNNKIDVCMVNAMGRVEQREDGVFVCKEIKPDPALMELSSSGREIQFIGYEPDVFEKSFDYEKDIRRFPVLIPAGSLPGQEEDVWASGAFGIWIGLASMPDDVLQELIRIRHENRKELGRYHSSLKLLPENPYPVGVPKKWIHPGVDKAFKNLGIPIP